MKPESEYLFVEVAAQRCLQLMRGARPKVQTGARKYTTLAITEVDEGLVPWDIRDDSEAELIAAGLAEPVEEEGDSAD
jgi:DNA-directed RNA polymerase subunit K/omega